MINKIDAINGLGLFNGKASFAASVEFKKYNIVYGYNGSGKTSLSRALRFLEKGEIPDSFKEENPDISLSLNINDSTLKISRENSSSINLPIRTFNPDFIWENIHWARNGSKGIVTISQEQKGLAEELDKKEKRLATLDILINGGKLKDSTGQEEKHIGKKNVVASARSDCESLLTKCATKQVKPNNWCSDKNFNKVKFEAYMKKALQENSTELSDEMREKYQKEASSHQKLDTIGEIDTGLSLDGFIKLLSDTESQLSKPVSRKAIAALKNAQKLEEWIKQGYRNHLHREEACPVCNNNISALRWEELSGHFSTDAEQLEIALEENRIKWQNFLAKTLPPPIKEKIHEAYYNENEWNEYDLAKKQLDKLATEVFAAINNKITNIENATTLGMSISELSELYKGYLEKNRTVNNKINQHDNYCAQQEQLKNDAEKKLIQDIASRNASEYQKLQEIFIDAENELATLQTEFENLPQELLALRAKLSEIGSSSEKINSYLKDYLGHSRFQLAVEGNGYSIVRNGNKSSAPLSEGEKTALAFCYFIASIQGDSRYRIEDMIIVIDDPVSSLDSRHLYYVLSFMKIVVHAAQQVFVLTHSFSFFKECQKGLASNKEQEDKNILLFYMSLKQSNGSFFSTLEPLPNALKLHESEYHYFSSKLFTANENGWTDDADLYGLANACRRVLESFLCFKLPSAAPLKNKIEDLLNAMNNKAGKLPSKTVATARERYIQIASHGDSLDKLLGLDNLTIDSAKDAVEFTLDFIQEADEIHFQALKKASR